MNLYKLKNHSLTTMKDMEFNKKFGLPIEVFCPKSYQTLAFGRIESVHKSRVKVNGVFYDLNKNAFFGHRNLTA